MILRIHKGHCLVTGACTVVCVASYQIHEKEREIIISPIIGPIFTSLVFLCLIRVYVQVV